VAHDGDEHLAREVVGVAGTVRAEIPEDERGQVTVDRLEGALVPALRSSENVVEPVDRHPRIVAERARDPSHARAAARSSRELGTITRPGRPRVRRGGGGPGRGVGGSRRAPPRTARRTDTTRRGDRARVRTRRCPRPRRAVPRWHAGPRPPPRWPR